MYGRSLYFLLDFAMNLKLPLKTSVLFFFLKKPKERITIMLETIKVITWIVNGASLLEREL